MLGVYFQLLEHKEPVHEAGTNRSRNADGLHRNFGYSINAASEPLGLSKTFR